MIIASITLAACLLAPVSTAVAQRWVPQHTETTAEFRALHAAGNGVVWAAGRGGVWTRTRDDGRTWTTDTVPGAESLFFTGVHAVDADTVILLGTSFTEGEGRAAVFRTTDGGRTWTMRWSLERAGLFLDALAFFDDRHGLALGDPTDGAFVLLATDDGGVTWHDRSDALPPAQPGEAGFAASGQALIATGATHAWIVTGGGARARVLHTADRGATWRATDTPLAANASTGLFGIAFADARTGWAVGGDYRSVERSGNNVLRTDDGGATWRVAGTSAPAGVRYGVAAARIDSAVAVIAVGPSGTGWSSDGGATWRAIDGPGFNSITVAPDGTVWAAGVEGRVARLDLAGAAPN